MTDRRSLDLAILFIGLAFYAAPAFPREVGSFDRTLNVTGAVDMEVETNSGHITVNHGSMNTVRIRGIITISDNAGAAAEQRARDIQANPPIRQNGNSIRIDRLPDSAGRQISISYEIDAPPQTKLRARSGSGAQIIEGLQGPVMVSTGSGSVRVSGIESDVNASTGSGGIELDGIRGRVDANAGSGGIRASNLASQVTARTGSGGVEIHLPASGGFYFHARTGSGRVSVNPPIAMDNSFSDSHEVRGKIRGGGPLIEVATGSGGVRVE